MTWQATTALLYRDAELAAASLRDRLRLIAMDDEAEPDWSTFRLGAVAEVAGLHGRTWYEWTATVEPPAEDADRTP